MGRKPFVRERILEAAFDLVARRGYEAVSSREIAKRAGVGPASMYRHFRSMEELGRTLYAVALAPLEAEFADLVADDPAPPELLRRTAAMLYTNYDRRPRALALLIFPPHDFTPHELAADNPHSIRNRFHAQLGTDPDTAALVWGALLGPLHDRYLHRRTDGSMAACAPAIAARVGRLLPAEEVPS